MPYQKYRPPPILVQRELNSLVLSDQLDKIFLRFEKYWVSGKAIGVFEFLRQFQCSAHILRGPYFSVFDYGKQLYVILTFVANEVTK